MRLSETQRICNEIERGNLTAEAALERLEFPSRHISEISVDNLKVDVLDCGFPSLNELMVFKENRGELMILGARPSMGKSALLFQIAAHVSKTKNVLIYSLEMDAESIKTRMLAAVTGKGLNNIQRGYLPREVLEAGNRELTKLQFYIDDRSGIDVQTLRGSALLRHEKTPLSLVVVDYLQMLGSGAKKFSRTEEVGEISAQLKGLAKDLKCPILVAAQLNRECERRGREYGPKGYIPIMSDLRESGNLEQDADVIMFLSRQERYDESRPGEADISIAKQRNGAVGDFIFRFHPNATRFEDPRREEDYL